MGSKPPAFIGDAKMFSIIRKRGSEASMLCNAQGHPVPVTRYQLIKLLLQTMISAFAIQHLVITYRNIIRLESNDFQCVCSGFLAFEIC